MNEINEIVGMEEVVDKQEPRLAILGIGGCGNNAIKRIVGSGISDKVELIALNTDAQDLEKCKMAAGDNSSKLKTVQLGKNSTKGLGAGGKPEVGKTAAEESKEEIKEILKDSDMVIITCGMGGGTGTGAAPVVAAISKEMGILTIAIVTKPFKYEGRKRARNAEEGIENLKENVDTYIVVPNEKLLKIVTNSSTTFEQGLKKADDEVLVKLVKGITDIIYGVHLVNLDFADVQTAMKGKGMAHIGMGYAAENEADKVEKAVSEAIQNELLDTSIVGASDVIVFVSGGSNFAEVASAFEMTEEKVSASNNDDCNIFTGYEEVNGSNDIRVIILATGISEYIDNSNNVRPNRYIAGSPLMHKATPTTNVRVYSANNPVSNFKKVSSISSIDSSPNHMNNMVDSRNLGQHNQHYNDTNSQAPYNIGEINTKTKIELPDFMNQKQNDEE